VSETSKKDTLQALQATGIDGKTLDAVKEMEEDEFAIIAKCKQDAARRVKTYVTLITEESSESKMATSIAKTPAGQVRGPLKVL